MKLNHLFVLVWSTIILGFGTSATSWGSDKAVIIGFHKEPGRVEQDHIQNIGGKHKRTHKIIRAVAATLPEVEIAKLKKDPRVAYVEEDAVVAATAPTSTSEYGDSWGIIHIGADKAHADGVSGNGVKIAVLDTGIDYNHPDLKPNYQGGINIVFPENASDPYDDSYDSHGTHVAGIVAAANNGTGVVGVAPEASLYAVKVLDGGGFAQISDLVAGIEWAIANKMNVVSMSWGVGADFISLKTACDSAWNAGIVLIAAAGNFPNSPVSFPAAYESVIAVTATDQSDTRGYYTSVGPEMELAAPGVGILSTAKGGGYKLLTGTSQSAPHVAGTAALLFGLRPADTNNNGRVNDEIRAKLQTTATDLGDPGPDPIYGFGLVNAAKAVQTPLIRTVNLKRTLCNPHFNAQEVNLPPGTHTLTIVNDGLGSLMIKVVENDTAIKTPFRVVDLKSGEEVITLTIEKTSESIKLILIPNGRPGTSAVITISSKI